MWPKNKNDKINHDLSLIENKLNSVGEINKKDILGFEQIDYIFDGVKVTFMIKQNHKSPVKNLKNIKGNIYAADLNALGGMKITTLMMRSKFRDYYDVYSLLKNGVSLKLIIGIARDYTKNSLKSKGVLSMITNGNNYKISNDFKQNLNPIYEVDHKKIESYIKKCAEKENILNKNKELGLGL